MYRNAIFRKKVRKCEYGSSCVGEVILINPNVIIGKNCCIYPYVQFWGDGMIEIGDNVDIGTGCVLYASANGGGVKVGNNTNIAAHCYIIDMDHGMAPDTLMQSQQNSVSPIHIGNDVWIAAGVKILKGSNIADGAVIGAQAVVKEIGELLNEPQL